MSRAYLSYFPSLLLLALVIAVATTVRAQPSQRDISYFVDAAGTEYDLEQEVKALNRISELPRAEQFDATLRNNSSRLSRWRVYLRNDGSWVPDPLSGQQDYADRHYPVEYVLPFGYRGTFQVAWDVPGAPPLQIVNGKIEIYISPKGIVETSSPQAGESGTVAAFEHQFYFELDGKRTVIPHQPLQRGQVGITLGTTHCREMSGRCYSYFVGSSEEWQAATSSKCQSSEEKLQAVVSGHDCYDLPPGSTQPVAEIVPPPGKAAIMLSEFHGRTVNGRRVVLSTALSGVTSWRFDGPEPSVPDEPALAAELKAYIETINDSTTPEGSACSPEQGRALLRSSLAGPYRFFRTPYSSKIAGEFVGAETSNDGTVYNGLLFARGEQGWKLLSGNCRIPWRQYETDSRLNTKTSEFVGRAVLQKQTPVVLRRDGTWDSDDPSALQLPEYIEKSFMGYDMNGTEIHFKIDDQGRATWRRVNEQAVQIRVETVISELNHALDRYIELLSAGNIEGFLAEGGEKNDAYEFYRIIEKYGDDSKEANEVYDFLKQTGDGQGLVREYGESNFKPPMKKWLLEGAIQSVDGPLTLQELKRLRSETPRIAPRVPFSPDFEALYTLHPKDPAQSQVVRRMTGHGSTWALHWD